MSFLYVATPYSLYRLGTQSAYELACEQVSILQEAGYPAFSPVAHWHGPVELGHFSDGDTDYWQKVCKPMMTVALGLVLIKADGWQQSKGMKWEADYFHVAGKPIFDVMPGLTPVIMHEMRPNLRKVFSMG